MAKNESKKQRNKIEYIECDCHHELIQLEYDKEDDTLYLSFYSYGKYDNTKGIFFMDKLKHIWQIIKKGHPYSDSICLNKIERNKLKSYLKKL